MKQRTILYKLWHDCEGAIAIEYAFIGSLIVVAIISGVSLLVTEVNSTWTGVSSEVVGAAPAS